MDDDVKQLLIFKTCFVSNFFFNFIIDFNQGFLCFPIGYFAYFGTF